MKNINSIILDTTYVLPLFGIKIELSLKFEEQIKLLWKNGINEYKVFLPSVCLIETVFKLLNEYRKKNDFKILDRYQLILPTILNSPIDMFNPELNSKASLIASLIRHSGHMDFMDCWIAGAAVALEGILLTEDKELEKILRTIPETKTVIIWSWNKLITETMKNKK
ncbi:MAG: PIN domain-containing protein [Candidatus Lokiarchaeota archaeon]|nr:PIN domain-containing protein [Candidatus Lokiarchaeota archaeon]